MSCHARVANVQKGDKVVVIGDGAVGQCAVIAAKMRGASQIILMSRHEDRQKMALESGGTASATTYDKQFLLKAVLYGTINPGRVFTSSYRLEEINQAYKDMDERKTIKSIIVIE